MLESHLKPGNQKLGEDKADLEYGKSITDGCIDWETTDAALKKLAGKLRDFRASISQNYV